MAARRCGECRFLVQTHPEQVFHRCLFWCGPGPRELGAEMMHGRAYVETHCHMQPWAEACDWWLPRIGESK